MPLNVRLEGQLAEEYKTQLTMVKIYCKRHHTANDDKTSDGLCYSCQSLSTYAEMKLDRCPYGEAKPTCNNCPIHCYKPSEKEQMRLVMRYSGPRMLLLHPILAIRHLRHDKRPVPKVLKHNASNRHMRIQSQRETQ